MKNLLNTAFVIAIVVLNLNLTSCQSKKQLKREIKTLRSELSLISSDKDSLKKKLDRISKVKVDDVITPDEQPNNVVIGESGWRVELNGNKYKSDLIGQLGTIWVLDDNSQLKPQGAISLAKYKMEANILNPDKDVLYKKFISKETKMEGTGSLAFASITAKLSQEQFSQFSINIEGTSQIKPKLDDLKKISNEANHLFSIHNNKGVFICTGMHVIRYNSRLFSKSTNGGQITTPMVNIGGEFYGESNEETNEFLVVRQLTQLHKQVNRSMEAVRYEIDNLKNIKLTPSELELKAKSFTPDDLLTYYINRQPSSDELLEFQESPKDFLRQIGKFELLSNEEKLFVMANARQLIELPTEVKSVQ